MAEPVVYAQCGLRLRSEVVLDLPLVDGGSWDVDVVRGPEVERADDEPPGELIAERRLPDDEGWWYRATETDDGFLLRFVDSGDVLVSADLSRVEVRPVRGGRSELLPVLLAGTVSAFLLAVRGATVLHASAVAIDGAALAFVGASGRGKTTLATLMCLDGASMVADDVLKVDPGPPPTCQGGATELRLRAAAAGLAAERDGAASRRTVDNRLALTVGASCVDEVRLAAIVFPAPSRKVPTLELRRVSERDALLRLLGLARVEGWTRNDVVERDFRRLGALATSVPLFTAIVPWGPPFLPTITAELAELAVRPER